MKAKLLVGFLLAATLLAAKENILLVNYGPEQSIREGDDDFQQVLFFKVAKNFADSLYVRIFDIDCGGEGDLSFSAWNTTMRYTLYGGAGAFSSTTLKNAKPEKTDLAAGQVLADATFGENKTVDNSWYNFAHIAPADGEKVGDSYYFKLVVQGLSGNDANVFDVRLSSSATMNVPVADVFLFSYSPTLRLRKDENVASITFLVPEKTKTITVHNFDLAGAVVQLVTAFRSNLPVTSSGQGEWAKSVLSLEPLETGRECAIAMGQGGEAPNDVSIYVTDDQERVLPIQLPVYLTKLNRRPIIQKSLIALSDCQSVVFDAKASTDADGDVLDFYWEFGDGSSATGSRVVHRYEEQKSYNGLLIVHDNSGEVGNSSFERFVIKVNQPPIAQAGKDLVTAPNKSVSFDGSRSADQDGRLTLYSWDFGDGKTASGSLATHSYVNPGTFRTILRVEDDSDSPCNFATDDLQVWVNAPPIAMAGEDQKGSIAKPVAFSAEKSSDRDGELVSYQWDFGDGSQGTGKIVQHAYLAPGNYRVKLTVTDNAAVDNSSQSDELVVFINDPPVARAGEDRKGAIEEILAFDGSNSTDKDGAIVGYRWDFGDGSQKEGKQVSHAYKKSGKYTISLSVQDNSGTDSNLDSDSLQVVINQPPVADAGQDQLVTASEVAFSAKGSHDSDGEISNYEWNFGDGSTGTGLAPVHVYAKPGTYHGQLTVTDNSGTKNSQTSDNITVVVNEKPLADAGPDQKGAVGQPISFDGSGSRDLDGKIAEYHWDFSDGQSASGQTVSHPYQRSGRYTARLAVKDNTGQEQAVDFDEAIIAVNSPPMAVAGPDRIIEPEAMTLFDASNSYDADPDSLSFQWQFSDGKEQAATAQTRRAFSSPGIYTAILTVNDRANTGNNLARDTVVVRVNSAPIANAGKNIYSCEKTLSFDGSLSVDPDGDPLTYSWDFGDGSKPSQGMQVLHKYAQGGVYPVILTVDDGLGLKNSHHTTSLTVTLNEPPIADAGKNETYCSGEVIIFNAGHSKDPEKGLLKYNWDFGDGTHAEGLNPTKIYKKDGVYLVTLTVKDDSGLPCNTDVVTKAIHIIESPVAMAGPDQEVCTNTQVLFDGTASRDFDGVVNNYFWDFGDGTTGGGATPSHAYKKAGVYRAVLTITGDLRGECDNTDTDELLVTVHDAPLAQIACPTIAPVNQSVYFDGSASISEGAAISEYLWDFGDGGKAQGMKVTHGFQKSGNYLVKLTISTKATSICNSAMGQKMIVINDQPVANAGPDLSVGINQVLTLDGSQSHDPDGTLVSFLWNFDKGESQSGIITRHRFSQAGRFPVVLTVVDHTTAENNTDRDTVWVNVNDPMVPVIRTQPVGPCPGESVTLTAETLKKTNAKTISCSWDFGDGQTAQGMQVNHSYAKSGRYNVTLIMDDGLSLDNSKTDTTITLLINHPPVAIAGGDRVTCPGCELVFDAGKSYDLDESNWTAEWDFGDGVQSTEKIVRHTFAKSGRYAVKLRITDHSGGRCASTEDGAMVMVNTPPVAVAGADRQVYYGGAHDAILFDATGSTDADGDGLTYAWNFGDNTWHAGAKVYHTFDRPGIYLVKLLVDDGRKTPCSQSQDEVRIEVLNRK